MVSHLLIRSTMEFSISMRAAAKTKLFNRNLELVVAKQHLRQQHVDVLKIYGVVSLPVINNDSRIFSKAMKNKTRREDMK